MNNDIFTKMKRKKIAIIGAGGRTGTMFAFELSKASEIICVSKEREVSLIKNKKLYIERDNLEPEIFKERVIRDTELQKDLKPDIILLATKNPVSNVIRYYYEKLKESPPALLISQNGISAIEDAKKALRDVFGKKAEQIKLTRIVLFNPIDKKEEEGKRVIKYSLPIKLAFAKASGEGGISDLKSVFEEAGIQTEEFSPKDAKNIEFSKLFLNLIGMASATRNFSVNQGFSDEETFREEVSVIKEYIKAVKLSKGKFVNFSSYPIKIFAKFFDFAPVSFLTLFRKQIGKIVSKGRRGKPKSLDEIEYYNGGVVYLGKKIGIKTPFNDKVFRRAIKKEP
jgi:ketopantoate reductase